MSQSQYLTFILFGTRLKVAEYPVLECNNNKIFLFVNIMLTEEAEVPVSGEGQKTPENNASPRSTSKVTHSHSSTFSCCHKGRDFENLHTNHVFSSDELQIMSKYESMNYLPQIVRFIGNG